MPFVPPTLKTMSGPAALVTGQLCVFGRLDQPFSTLYTRQNLGLEHLSEMTSTISWGQWSCSST
jgi:hypothetical protein